MADPRIDRFYVIASGRCINCEKRIRSQVYLEWQEEGVFLCSQCLMALYDHIFTIKTPPNSPKRYKKAKIDPEFRWRIWQRDNFTCQYCGTRSHLAIDHILPESRGGSLDESNVVTACETCNSKKSA